MDKFDCMNQNLKKTKTSAKSPMLHRSWHEDRSLCLGGAGISIAIALAVFQVHAGKTTDNLKVLQGYELTLTCALCAAALWTALWQMGDTYAYWESKKPEKVQAYSREKWGIPIFAFAIAFLIVAILTLLLASSLVGAVVFMFVVAFALMVVFKHAAEMKKMMAD